MSPLKYRMPAEWETHEATWLTWPTNKITWPGTLLKRVEEIYLEMMRGLLPGEKVQLLVDDVKTGKRVLGLLAAKKIPSTNLILHEIKTVDVWIRDYGPIFVKKRIEDRGLRIEKNPKKYSEIAFTKWIFNGWGGKYADLARDTKVVDKSRYLKNFNRFDPGIIMEGGSIDVNGLGTLLTTEQCLLNKNRNPKLSRRQIEKYLKLYLGIKKTIWLKEGIEADDTDGHVDDITRFAGPRTILTAVECDPLDKNHAYLEENLHLLKASTDQDGKKFNIIELPMPGIVGPARTDAGHHRLPASYANFYIGNHAVLVPIYSHRNDKTALKIIRKAFPAKKVIGIECSALVYGLGSIHCVTQQQPR